MTPRDAASRSSSDNAAAIHVALLPSSAPPTTAISPPPPRLVSSRPPSPIANDSGPRFDARTTGRAPAGEEGGGTSSTYPPGSGHHCGVRLVAAPDKLRGTASAADAAAAICRGATTAGWQAGAVPVADGG